MKVKAKDRLPEDDKEVFVKNNGYNYVLYHSQHGWYDGEGCLYLVDTDKENNHIEWIDESTLDYWQQRCEAAEAYIKASVGDPDATASSWKAHQHWEQIKSQQP